MNFKKLLADNNIDALIISDPYNMRYLSGFTGEGYVYVSENRLEIITDSRYTTAAGHEKKDGFLVEETSLSKNAYAIIEGLILADKAGGVGYEDLCMICHDFELLRKHCAGAKLIPLGDALNRLRIIKTPEELELLRTAESIGDMAFSHILEALRPGMTELEVAAELEYSMKKNGAEGLSFSTIAASGLNSACPHAVPSDKPLEKGDFLTMDFGCIYKGYCSDMTRTVVIGKANDRQRDVYNTVLKAQTEAMKHIRSGVIGADIHKVAADVIAAAGYGGFFGHGLGHSVGLYIHENPRFSPGEKKAVYAGTIETVEPGIYIPDFGGVRIEDMIVITENGYENFSHSPKELIEIN